MSPYGQSGRALLTDTPGLLLFRPENPADIWLTPY